MSPSAVKSRKRSHRLTTTVVATGTRAALTLDEGADGDFAEEERRQQEAQPREIADVGVTYRDPRLGAAEQENPPKAPQHQADDGEDRGDEEASPESGRQRGDGSAELTEDQHRAEDPGQKDAGGGGEQQQPDNGLWSAAAASA